MTVTFRYSGILVVRTPESAKRAVELLCELAPGHRPRLATGDWLVVPMTAPHALRGATVPNLVVLYDIEDDRVFPDLWREILPCLDRPNGEPPRVYRLGPIRIPGL